MRTRWLLLTGFVATATAVACRPSDGRGPSSPYVTISGIVRDWSSQAPVAGASLRTLGVERTATSGADGTFLLTDVFINGYVVVEARASGYAATLSPPILVEDQDLTGVVLEIIADGDATAIETGFGVTDSAGRGHILGTAVQASGQGYAGLSTFGLAPSSVASSGPRFFANDGSPAPGAGSTSSNGAFAFLSVSAGNVAVWATHPGLSFDTTGTVVVSSAWSLVVLVGEGSTGPTPTPLPQETPACASPTPRFQDDIYDIFRPLGDGGRGCTVNSSCHQGGGAASGLRLDGNPDNVHSDLLNGRIDLTTPENSKLLTKPLFGNLEAHLGGDIFLTTADPDYVKIFCWITDGAPNNGGD